MPEHVEALYAVSSFWALCTVLLGTITFLWGWLNDDFWTMVKTTFLQLAVAGTAIAMILTLVYG